MRTILIKPTFDGKIEIKKCVIGYAIYDCGEFESWSLTLKAAKRKANYLSGSY